METFGLKVLVGHGTFSFLLIVFQASTKYFIMFTEKPESKGKH